jgi:phosphatidylserine decarboxylase
LKDFLVGVRTFAAAQILRVIPRARVTRAVGRLCETRLAPPLSALVAGAYCRAYRVNIDEAFPGERPYPTFDAFFTRRLRNDARSISADQLVSPADGMLSAVGTIDSGSMIRVKGRPYDVGELVGDYAESNRYRGGAFAVVYLSPSDYHRVHSPVDGTISLVRGMPGDYFPVNSIGEAHVPRLFVRNNRVAIVIDTSELGRVTLVMVGAYIVGRISVSVMPDQAVPAGIHTMAVRVSRGEEIGVFHLGSTVVLLVEPGIDVVRRPGRVLYGESLLKAS